MDRRDFLETVGFAAASLALGGCSGVSKRASETPGHDRPNIIFIMTDDQGPWAFGAAPDPNARTPNIDRLVAQGARLTNYFVTTPVCSPSRAGLITSRYATEVGVPDYLTGEANRPWSAEKFPVWPRILAEGGYETALIGKWHLGSQEEYHPGKFGYGEFAGFRVGGRTSKDPDIEIDGRVRQVEGYTPDILTDLAIDFVRRKSKKRFLLSLHFWAPHANTKDRSPDGDRTWLPLSDADWGRFKDSEPKFPEPDYPNLDVVRLRRMTREYMASIAAVDRNLGRLLGVLDELRLSDNTVVIFTSDNGYNMGHHGIWHKGNGRWILLNNREHRPNLWDNSLKVPAIVRWPGVIKPSVTVDETVTNLDWFPTILATAGMSPPREALTRGRNFLPLLKGENISWNNDLFAQYKMWEWHQNGADLRCYRTRRWKLVRDFAHDDKDELYDLANDPAEAKNLINSPDPAVRKIRWLLDKRLLREMRRINDPALEQQKKNES